jgi:hypothetical protein
LGGKNPKIMPTISEILAAKAAKKAATVPTATPGKPKSNGLVLNNAPLPPQPEPAPQPTELEPRSLSERSGEAIPMVPVGADPETVTWHEGMNALETDLCVMQDPTEPEVAWLAIRSLRPGLKPLLLHRLPWALWLQQPEPTEDQPF